MKNKKSIADNIRRIRESLGYSQDYVAIRLDISQQAYSTIEKTPEKSTLSRLRQISEILQVPLVTLLGECGLTWSDGRRWKTNYKHSETQSASSAPT